LHKLFPSVDPHDIPFAEDGLGDQYLLRDGFVHRLSAEVGKLTCLNVDLERFDAAVRADPVGYLSLEPLEEFRAQGGVLEPGQLLSVYPAFVMKESAAGRSYRAIATEERIRFLADFARQIAEMPDGSRIEIRLSE
jgi:hypothetical protein